ncbi:MAG: DNA mismatch repair protein MutS [Clostridia bacterium]|nr:DNA mismatch repair protein MutS [Clostridia bacterium]
MMQQYFEIKNKYREYILMYRLGDFYEMFFEDAKTVSRELELTLTGRDCGEKERAPMCGVPYHSAEGYIGKLVSKGYKVAICEQLEDPALAKGIVKRDVVRMITPGTLTETALLDEKKNNYLCAVYVGARAFGVAFADISTGQAAVTAFEGEGRIQQLIGELGVYAPREIVINGDAEELGSAVGYLRDQLQAVINQHEDHRFTPESASARVRMSFSDLPTEFDDPENISLLALGGLISYMEETQRTTLQNLGQLNYYKNGQYLEIDLNTRRSLELCETMRRAEKKGTLLWVLDKTRTAAGARLLRKYIDQPLKNPHRINRRQAAVAELCTRLIERGELMEALSGVLDLERLITRIVYGTANARDLRAVSQTAGKLPEIRNLLASFESEELSEIYRDLDLLTDVYELIESSIVDEPPFSVREGGLIRAGFHKEVDYLTAIEKDSKGWIERIEETERESTGIKTLKVGYNRVFGYYIEVSKSYIKMVPERYMRKQTLVGGERYITRELKEKEAEVIGAGEKRVALEYQLFTEIRTRVAENVHRIQKLAYVLAKLDVYCSLAEVACRNGYCRPEVGYGDVISIRDGRHPVVEQFAKDAFFVPNDTELDNKKNRFMLITGPNMAGKSTYMRQVALICIMAQIGSFVPAREARICVLDKVFTRVGASDDLAMGQSTFMLEMSEVAYILANATKQSLIIYDEIGRGTSTYDGMSIARAVAEYTLGKRIGAKTLFATHYHELTGMESECEGVVNYHIAAKKRGEGITFLRKIVRGAADDSYGIEVAQLAGVPHEVTKRAREVLAAIEADDLPAIGKKREEKPKPKREETEGLISFESFAKDEVADKLKKTDINTISPLEALNLIFELKKMLDT